MKKSLKRILSTAVVICMFVSMAASAAWEFAGYDTTNPPQYQKIYNEKIDGVYTSKSKAEPVAANDVEWKFEGFELSYPHVGYERLYLEGNAQNAITRTTDLYPQWETRFQDFMWEVCGNHEIYQRQQTKINNQYWAWDFGNDALGVPDSDVFVPTNRYAKVTDEWKVKGIANFDTEGNIVFDDLGNGTADVYNKYLFDIEKRFALPAELSTYTYDAVEDKGYFEFVKDANGYVDPSLPENFFCMENLSQIDPATGKFVVTDAEIAAKFDIVSTKYTTGPSFYGENPTKDVADMFINHRDKWVWDDDVAVITNDAVIEWTAPIYEMAEPYLYYQFLVVNGLVFDGRNDTPEIKRYTGGKATPEVEWRYCFAQAAAPFEVIEVKYIKGNDGNMVMAVEDGNPVVRIPTGEFANSYFVVTDTKVQLWIEDGVKSYLLAEQDRTLGDFGALYEGYTNGANYID